MRLLPITLAFAAVLSGAELGNFGAEPDSIVAHEWGTFTSIAGAGGDPVRWNALTGPPELPCFVNVSQMILKSEAFALVRMETPVLYFYSSRPAKVSVDVDFPLGSITEWYPSASAGGGRRLHYDSVELMPGPDPAYPTSQGPSRYFAARNTDATPLKIGNEMEKMIFYRGVGGLSVPLRPEFTPDGKIQIRNVSPDAIPLAILFENRDGHVGYRAVTDFREGVVDPPELNGSVNEVKDLIVKTLESRGGLYAKEAQAMMDTWQDSWFEEGMRLIYLLPQREVAAVLPLRIDPAPAQVTRAYVGRVEMLSPAMQREIHADMSSGDANALEKFGRFLGAFAPQVNGMSNATYRKASADVQSKFSGACVR